LLPQTSRQPERAASVRIHASNAVFEPDDALGGGADGRVVRD